MLATVRRAAVPSAMRRSTPSEALHILGMRALGVSKVQLGLFASAAAASQLLSTLVGGHVADRFVRKRTLVAGGIICWVIPLFLYTVARSPLYFLVGQLLNGFVYLVIPAFECLLVEEVPEDGRPAVFGAVRLAYALASLSTSLPLPDSPVEGKAAQPPDPPRRLARCRP